VSAADAARAAVENTRVANLVKSTQDGYLDASRLIQALRDGCDGSRLLQETLDRITALHDPDRLAAFHRRMAKARRAER
jgi:hypothetical protein